jgi:hypothetical protein
MMVIEQIHLDPWKHPETHVALPPDYEVLRTDTLPNGHYALWLLYDGDEPPGDRLIRVVACNEAQHALRFEFPKHHRFLGGIHPPDFDTCYYLFDVTDGE